MKQETLCDLIGDIDEKYIEEAHAQKKSVIVFLEKWGAVAACAVVLCVICVFMLPLMLPSMGRKGSDGQEVEIIELVQLNGCYYEAILPETHKDVLDRYNLPYDITPEMVGEELGKGIVENGQESGIFYTFHPYSEVYTTTSLGEKRAQQAVYVYYKNGVYQYALYCNPIFQNDSSHVEAKEMFAVYGVDEATDIVSITLNHQRITDSSRIKAIYDEMIASASHGNDYFQKKVYGGKSEEEQERLSCIQAENAIRISMETKEGIQIHNISYYPTNGFLYWALSYYEIGNNGIFEK